MKYLPRDVATTKKLYGTIRHENGVAGPSVRAEQEARLLDLRVSMGS
jgi:hypothetical protein